MVIVKSRVQTLLNHVNIHFVFSPFSTVGRPGEGLGNARPKESRGFRYRVWWVHFEGDGGFLQL